MTSCGQTWPVVNSDRYLLSFIEKERFQRTKNTIFIYRLDRLVHISSLVDQSYDDSTIPAVSRQRELYRAQVPEPFPKPIPREHGDLLDCSRLFEQVRCPGDQFQTFLFNPELVERSLI